MLEKFGSGDRASFGVLTGETSRRRNRDYHRFCCKRGHVAILPQFRPNSDPQNPLPAECPAQRLGRHSPGSVRTQHIDFESTSLYIKS